MKKKLIFVSSQHFIRILIESTYFLHRTLFAFIAIFRKKILVERYVNYAWNLCIINDGSQRTQRLKISTSSKDSSFHRTEL